MISEIMRWPAREVAVGAMVAGVMNLLPGCGTEFARGVSAGGDANAGTTGGGGKSGSGGGKSGGAPSTGGKAGSVPGGAAGAEASAGAGGSNGSASGGAGGDVSMSHAGAAGEGSVACEVELLTNGGFDTLNSGWVQMADPARGLILHQSSDILMDMHDQPVSPEYMLLLGGVDSDHSSVLQQVHVPENALLLVVSFYLHAHTEEGDAQIYDSVTMNLSTSATESSPFATYTNFDTNEDWERVSFQLDATVYRGTTPNFVIASETDVGGNTHFMFDSFSIIATLCE